MKMYATTRAKAVKVNQFIPKCDAYAEARKVREENEQFKEQVRALMKQLARGKK